MQPKSSSFRLRLALLLGLLTAAPAAQAQSPTVTRASLAPAANARAAARNTTVVLPFSQAIDPATVGNIKVHSQQYRGRRTATASVNGSTVTLTPTVPATGSQVADFKPGETVFVTVPATVRGTGSQVAMPYVYQFTAAVTGGGTLAAGSDPGVGSLPYGVALGDVDGDGDLDLLTVSGTATSIVSVQLNGGDATGSNTGLFSGTQSVSVSAYTFSLALGDVDGDGDLDIVTVSGAGVGDVRLNGGNNSGSNTGVFSNGSSYTAGASAACVTLGDIDGDGDLDLITANYSYGDENTLSVRLNGGNATGSNTGVFSGTQEVSTGVGAKTNKIALGDVDGDGDLDLVAANYGLATVSIKLNGGNNTGSNTGIFTPPAVAANGTVSMSPGTWGVTLGDVDGDGDLDFVTSSFNSTASVRLNGGDATGSNTGVFSGTHNVSVGANAYNVKLGDVDGDGDLDLLTANSSTTTGTASVRLNGGDATGSNTGLFAAPIVAADGTISIGTNANSLALGDVDGDGDLDLVTTNGNTTGTASVRLNANRPPISSFTPLAGPVGTSVVITGTGTMFTGVTGVRFNATAATAYIVNSATQITATVPAGATTGAISVTTLGGTFTSANFTVLLTPTVTSLTPARNARTAARSTTVGLGFNTAIDPATAGTIKVFSQQYRGQRTATASTSGSTVTLTPTVPATGSQVAAFKPGETVFVTVPASVQSTGGVAASKYVYQFTAAATGGPGNFLAPATNPDPAVGNSPVSVAVGDVDGDGDLDLLAANLGSNTVSVRLNDGTGNFTAPATNPNPAVGNFPYRIAVGDVDGDGDLDLVTANSGYPSTSMVSVRLNDGTGNFTAPATNPNPAVGDFPLSVVLGDVDGDGDLDLLTANAGVNTVSVRLNNGSGSFTAPATNPDPFVGSGPSSVVVGDVDGDGDLDLLTANVDDETVSLRLNDGTGNFTAPATNPNPAVGCCPQAVALGDVDGDGDLDLLTANSNGTVSVRLNNGSGSFTAPATNPDPAVGSSPLGLAVGDVDGDGDLDLLTGNSNGTVSVRLNNGSGSFTAPATNPNPAVSGSNHWSVVLGDVDGDGDLDLLTANADISGVASVRLNVAPNLAPTALALSPSSVAENAGANATVGTFTTTDPNAGNTFTYSLVTGTGSTDNASFNISGSTLRLTASANYETKPSYAIRVQTTDQGGLSFVQTFTISITNVNEAPTGLALSNSTLAENGGTNATVGTFTTTDPDAGNTFTYSLVTGTGSTDNASFTITNVSGTGTLRLTASADYETKPSYAIRVLTTDQGGLTFVQTFTISITNVNEAPTALTLSNSTLAENGGTNATVGTFTTTDPDAGNTFTYALVTGTGSTDNGSFTISGSTLRLTASADYEIKPSYSIRVQTTDQGGLTFVQTFTISITNVNEAPVIAAQSRSVAENVAIGTLVGAVLTATDPEGTALSYSITAGNSAGKFALDSSTGQLTVAGALDYETTASYALTVQVSDGSLSSSATVTVSITNVNEAPTALALSNSSVAENAGANATVGTFTTTDPDASNTFTYALATGTGSTDNGSFTISGSTLLLTASADYETQNSYAVRVRTTDQGGLYFEQTFTISISNQLEFTTTQTNVACYGGSTGTAAVGTLNEGVGPYLYSWSPGGNATASRSNLAAGTYTVTVTDANGLSGSRPVVITQPAAALAAAAAGQTNATCGASNGSATVSASGGTTPYSYTWNTTPVQTMATGTVTGLAPGTYTVTVTDAAGCTATSSFTITNTPDTTPPTAVAQNVTLTLDATGTATLSGTDVDNGSTDNCGIVSRTLSRSTFSCADVAMPGTPSASLSLTASSSQLQYVLTNAPLSGGTTGTFETWLRTTSPNTATAGIMVTSTLDGGSGSFVSLRWNGSGRVVCEGLWMVAQTSTSPILNDGGWHHVAVVADGSTSKLYIDGVLNNTGTVATAGAVFTGRRIALGTGRGRAAVSYSTMELDNTRVWSVFRTPAQVADGKDNTTPASTAGLQLAYTYETITGNSLSDVSGNAQDATLYGSPLPTRNPGGGVLGTLSGTPVTLTVTDAAGNSSTAAARVVVQQPSVASTPSLTWTGTAGTTWSDCGNWSYGLVPTASQTVTIPAGLSNYPTLSSGTATLAGLTVASGASFTLASGATLQITGNVDNQGPTLAGTVLLNGTGAQTAAGSFGTLTVNKASGATTLSADASVAIALTLATGILSTGSNTLTLAPTATLTETAASYVSGTVQTTRDLSTATANDFGGLGLTLTPAASSPVLGRTLVKRVTGTARTGLSGRTGIARSFDIQPAVNSGLNVTLTMTYREAELNGIAEASLALFKSETGAADSWGRQRNVALDASANTATLAGVLDFSIWTLGDANAPLPVELATFTAQAEGAAARLQWTTASEKNNAYFDVERSRDGREFVKIGQEQGQGSKASPTSYTFLDKHLPAGTSYYRLRQVDLDGAAGYSPVRTVIVAATLAASFVVYPTEAAPGQSLRYAYTGPALPADAELELYDATGRRVQRQAADTTGVLNVQNLTIGWYWVRLHTASGSQQARFYQP